MTELIYYYYLFNPTGGINETDVKSIWCPCALQWAKVWAVLALGPGVPSWVFCYLMLFGLTPRLYGFHTSRFSPHMSSLGYTDGLCVLVTRGRLWIVSAKIHRRRHISLVSKLTCQSICLCARPGSFPESTDGDALEAWARGAQLFILFLVSKELRVGETKVICCVFDIFLFGFVNYRSVSWCCEHFEHLT